MLDDAMALYSEILDLIESRLKPGALIVADNTDYSLYYLARVRSHCQMRLGRRNEHRN